MQAVVSGLAHHSVALVVGYALCLVTLLARQRAALTDPAARLVRPTNLRRVAGADPDHLGQPLRTSR